MQVSYPLDRLFEDQDPTIVIDTIPAVLAWAPEKPRRRELGFSMTFSTNPKAPREEGALTVTWSLPPLLARDPGVAGRAARMREGTSPHREHLAEVAGYGLALCAISALLPGRRVVAWSRYAAPDLLFDATPGALRGVEVAARSAGGAAKLREVEAEKRPTLHDDPDVKEAWLSLWCQQPKLGWLLKVKS